MLSALDNQRHRAVVVLAKSVVINKVISLVPDLRQKKLASWIAQCVGEGPRLGKFGQNKEGLESVPGGVQVQQPVHRTNNGKQLMGAACLNAVGIFLQQLVVPQPIKVPV